MNFNSIMIGSENVDVLAAYYADLFGKPNWEDSGYVGWQIGQGIFTIGPHDGVKGKSVHPGRVMWNIEVTDVRGEFERLKAAGAIVIAEPYDPGGDGTMLIATFADPDDNYFQLMSPMPEA